MAHDIEDSIVIQAPPELVWRWAAGDPERERQWRNLDGKGVQTLERLDDGELGVGSEFRGTVKVGPGKPQAYVNEITELEVNRRIAWRTIDADGSLGGVGSYELTPMGDSTRFDIRLDYPVRRFTGHLLRPIVKIVGRRFIRRSLQKLKASVEQEAAPA